VAGRGAVNAFPATKRAVAMATLLAASAGASAATYATRVAAGPEYNCAVVNGAAWCWGNNANGQLGNGTLDMSGVPVPVAGLGSGVSAIAASGSHACAVVNGAAKCWGHNGSGQLGDNTIVQRTTPVQVAGLEIGVTAIATGYHHSCAIVSGAVKCWGANLAYGQLGDGTSNQSLAPVQVTGLTGGATAISSGRTHTCAVVYGQAYCWGSGGDGELGTGGTSLSRVPVAVATLPAGATAVAGGGYFSCAAAGGAARCWGFGGSGQLGQGAYSNSALPVQPVGLSSGVTAVAAGDSYHACAVAGGGLHCWGYNNWGQLGHPAATGGSSSPLPVVGLASGVRAVTAGNNHTCATAARAVHCWGGNTLGQLGTGSASDRATSPVLAIAAPPTRNPQGDANGNGAADLFWREAAPGKGLSWWTMSGAAIAGANYFEVGAEWQVAAVGDLGGDGKADLVWRRATDGATYLWTLDGLVPTGFFDLGILDPAAWQVAGVGDLDADGRDDLVWRHADGTLYAWLMNNGAIVGQGVSGNPGAAWQVAGIADLNGDGKADLLMRHTANGEAYALFMNGVAIAGGGSYGALDPAAWAIPAVADFDGDGVADILWRSTAGDTFLWRIDGPAVIDSTFLGNPGAAWQVAAAADLDGDGKADLVWRHADGSAYYWKMNGATPVAFQPIGNPGAGWQVVAP